MGAPNKVLIEKVGIFALVVVLGATFLYSKSKSAKARMSSNAEMASGFNIKSAKEGLKTELAMNAGISQLPDSMRDPLKRPDDLFERKKAEAEEKKEDASPAREENFVLQGVIWNAKENMAIISGNVVTQGEKIDGATVKRITKDEVVLARDGAEIKLKKR